jgi:hypothetical protein
MYFRLTLFVLMISFCNCNSVDSKPNDQPTESNQRVSKPEIKETIVFTEPLEYPFNKVPENIQAIWKEFMASGRYHLSQPSDMTFSETAKLQLPGKGESRILPYEYIWGDLNYDKRIEDDHLAAIVVDTTKKDQNRFSLVIFSPIKNTKDRYDINWLYRDKDLSKTTISRASSEFYVIQFSEDGTRKACSVNWNKKLQVFECN